MIANENSKIDMRWTLRRKILLGYSTALLLLLLELLWAVFHLVHLQQASEAILKENYKSILAAENMIDAIERQDSAVILLLLTNGTQGLDQFRAHESQFLQWLGRAKDNITIPDEDKIISRIESGYQAFLGDFSSMRTQLQATEQMAHQFYNDTLHQSFSNVRDECARLRDINHETMFLSSERARQIAHSAIISMAILGVVALVSWIGFSLFLATLLAQPLGTMTSAIRRITEGNYDALLPVETSDEFGLLASDFNKMVRQLNEYQELNIEKILMEKRKSEGIIQSIDDGIVVIDSDLMISDINPSAARIFGVHAPRAIRHHFLEMVRSETLMSYVKHSLTEGSPPPLAENQRIFKLGDEEKPRYYQFSITPIQSKQGPLEGVVLLLRDITRLKELDRMKSEFIITASHELRTPLTSIIMSIKLLRETISENAGERELKLLDVASEELQRLHALVNSLLDLSKIQAGKMEMDFSAVDVRFLIDKTLSIFAVQARDKELILTGEVDEGVTTIRADATKILWVLSNLVSNALRYTNHKGHIQIEAESLRTCVQISVQDDGIGIPAEDQSRIFDKFVQLKTERDVGGSGLGLAISREIVRAHGGSIWVESTPEHGSTFTFTIPVFEE